MNISKASRSERLGEATSAHKRRGSLDTAFSASSTSTAAGGHYTDRGRAASRLTMCVSVVWYSSNFKSRCGSCGLVSIKRRTLAVWATLCRPRLISSLAIELPVELAGRSAGENELVLGPGVTPFVLQLPPQLLFRSSSFLCLCTAQSHRLHALAI